MKLNPPKQAVWLLCLVLCVVGFLIHFGVLAVAGLAGTAFWWEAIGLVVLLVATAVRGL